MNKKQEIYQTILRTVLPFLRSTLSRKIVYGRVRKDAYELSQLIHNIYVSVFEEEFVAHDMYILNVHAKSYYETAKGTYHYDIVNDLIAELFEEVPQNMREQLTWEGPKKRI